VLDYSKSFIETQFPVSKISKESYKERKAGSGQTLTGLGKWWGRKPLILVRATLLGVLMPVSENPAKDREIFLKILTMDEEGLWKRKKNSIPIKELTSVLSKVELDKYFASDLKTLKSNDDKELVQKLAFNRLSYDDKLKYCARPEQYQLIDKNTWGEINNHLETAANNLQELIRQLGERRFGHIPSIGDCFAGGGSIPFESARMGANSYASDLNPVAVLLNQTVSMLMSSTTEEIDELKKFQESIYKDVEKKIDELGFETNSRGHKADTFLYCNETICPECAYIVPLAPSWVIGAISKTIAMLEDNNAGGYEIKIISSASKEQIKKAEELITIKNNSMHCPHCKQSTPVASLRNDKRNGLDKNVFGLRQWAKNEFAPKTNDVFQERLYTIRYIGEKGGYYVAPSEKEIADDIQIAGIVARNLSKWQNDGLIPSVMIEEGYNTTQLLRERGWKFWHHLFTPRQLLTLSILMERCLNSKNAKEAAIGLSILNKVADRNSKLCRWDSARENAQQTFYNQALNTLFNYVARGWKANELNVVFDIDIGISGLDNIYSVSRADAREVDYDIDIAITDPPYADAVNYHELTEFFLAWDKKILNKYFPEFSDDSSRALAVKGKGASFSKSMIEVYKNLSNHMPENGLQIVMFTHQDVRVWAELSMILWSAGLRVVSAWNVATETEASGLKSGGNYVKGTVLLTLKKQTSDEIAFQDELYDEIKREVKYIINSMKELDDKDDPDFTDADFLLASYASALKALTAYREIDGIDVEYWLSQPRDQKKENPIEALINKAVRIAYDYLIPGGFDTSLWRDLKPEERFYIRGLEVEMSGVTKISSYQELARGFGVSDYTDMFANFKANLARLKTPSEYRMTSLNGDGFTSTILRHLLVAIHETTENKSTVEGRTYLKNVYQQDNQYWYKKPLMIELLTFIANLEYADHMKHWHEHAYSAKLLREALKNEGV